ncbi:MAG: hypothetical protein N2490_07795 [Ignavibacteria bacterium]|nr:hypothetical protein [Ignavibacteria bacterium]
MKFKNFTTNSIKFILIIAIFIFTNTLHSQSYINAKYAYRINLPKTWKISYEPSKEDAYLVVAENENGSKLSVIVYENNYYAGKTVDNLGINHFIGLLKKNYSDVNFITSDMESLENDKILYAIYSAKKDDEDLQIGQYYIIEGTLLYIIQIEAKPNLFPSFEETGKGYAYTFSLIGKKTGKYVTNTKFNFRIAFPEGWTVQSTYIPYRATDNTNLAVINVNVYDDDEFKGLTAKDLDFEELIEGIREKRKDIRVDVKIYTMIDNVPAAHLKYDATEVRGGKQQKITFLDYYIIRDNYFYFIQCSVPVGMYLNYKDRFNSVIESFQFTK